MLAVVGPETRRNDLKSLTGIRKTAEKEGGRHWKEQGKREGKGGIQTDVGQKHFQRKYNGEESELKVVIFLVRVNIFEHT